MWALFIIFAAVITVFLIVSTSRANSIANERYYIERSIREVGFAKEMIKIFLTAVEVSKMIKTDCIPDRIVSIKSEVVKHHKGANELGFWLG